MSTRMAVATVSILLRSDSIIALLCVISFDTSYHACANCFTISTPSGLVNALAQRLLLRSSRAAAVWF